MIPKKKYIWGPVLLEEWARNQSKECKKQGIKIPPSDVLNQAHRIMVNNNVQMSKILAPRKTKLRRMNEY